MDDVVVLALLVEFSHGSYGWSKPKLSLLFVCILEIVPSQTFGSDILSNITLTN